MLKTAIKAVATGVAGLAISAGATAAVTHYYTGNPFDQSQQSTAYLGNYITASVTFADSVVGYTGTVDASSVLSWAIRIAQIPGSEMGSASGAAVDDWPLYFVFDNGAITEWQVLARPTPRGSPEIYTTHNSPFSRIIPTGDVYFPGDGSAAYNKDLPGTWAIPEPGTYLLMFGGLAMLGAVVRHRRR